MTDTAKDNPPPPKPVQVDLAVRLLWLTLGLGVVNSALQWKYFASTMSMGMLLWVQFATFAVLAWFTTRISAGRNWARIAYLVMLAVGVPVLFTEFQAVFGRSVVAGSISVAQFLLQLVAMALVFTGPGRRWFAARGKAQVPGDSGDRVLRP